MPIPWTAILTHGPHIVAAARSLLANQPDRPGARDGDFEGRIDTLEKTSVDTARLLQQMAEQLQALTLAQQAMQARLRLATILAGLALAAGIAAVLIAVLG